MVDSDNIPDHQPFPTYDPQDDFPVRALPEIIQAAVLEACQNEQVPAALAVQSALAAASLACQDRIFVRRREGLESVCSLFLLTVAETGSRKTRVDDLFIEAIRKYDAKMRAEYESAALDYEKELKTRRDEERGLRNAYTRLVTSRAYLRSAEDNASGNNDTFERALASARGELDGLHARPLSKPRLKRLLYSQISTRALGRSLYDNWPAAGLFSNEAGDIVATKTMSDLSRLDRLWDGQPIDVVDLREKDSVHVSDPRLTMSLMIQPSVFDLFLKRKGQLAKGIGFFPRTLISRPDAQYGKRTIDHTRQRSTGWLRKFNARILLLLENGHRDLGKRSERTTLYFSPEAQQIWDDDYDEKERGMVEDGKYFNDREFVNRYSEHVARVAALFHWFSEENESDKIEPHSLKGAIEVCEWYLEKYSEIFNPEITIQHDAKKLLEMLQKRLKGGGVGVYQYPGRLGEENRIMVVNILAKFSPGPLRDDKDRFEMALMWLDKKGQVNVFDHKLAGSKKETRVVGFGSRFTPLR